MDKRTMTPTMQKYPGDCASVHALWHEESTGALRTRSVAVIGDTISPDTTNNERYFTAVQLYVCVLGHNMGCLGMIAA
jgi:hypothetical protein